MHDFLFARAILPEPSMVMGLAMRPYSIGHELYLLREQNALALPERKVKDLRPELMQAALICSQTWLETQAMNRDSLLRLKLWIWKRRTRRLPLRDELRAFVQYRRAGSLEIPVSDAPRPGNNSPGRLSGAPFILRLHQFLVTKTGLTREAAWDYPFGLAKMEWECWHESEGNLDLYNQDDSDTDRFIAEQEALGEKSIAAELGRKLTADMLARKESEPNA